MLIGQRKKLFVFSAAVCIVVMTVVCAPEHAEKENKRQLMTLEEVKKIMNAHVDALMAIEGVEGVYVGAYEHGGYCIKVMLATDDKELIKKIPPKIDGCPVITEVTGKIRAYDEEGDTSTSR